MVTTWVRDLVVKALGVVQSRKFWALLLAVVTARLSQVDGTLTSAQFVLAVTSAVVAYIFGVALEDGLARHNQ